MAGLNGRQVFNTSPNSSEELESNNPTPATKVSVFSPNDVRDTNKPSSTGIVRSKIPPAFTLTQGQSAFTQNNQARHTLSSASQDPFVSNPNLSATTQSSTDASKLSPIASTFTPQSILTSSSASSVVFSEPSGGITISPQQFRDIQSKLQGLEAPPGLSLPVGLHNDQTYNSSDSFNVAATSTAAEKSSTNHFVGTSSSHINAHGSFSTATGASRCIMVSQVATDCPAAAIEGFFSPAAFGSVKNVVFADLVMASTVYIQFGDLRDVAKAVSTIENSPWGWSVQTIDPRVFAIKSGNVKASSVSKYEAQVLVTVKSIAPRAPLTTRKKLIDLICEALGRSGDLMAIEEFQSFDSNESIYRAEFCSVDAVDRLLINSTWLETDNFILNTKRYQPDIEGASPKRTGPLIIGEEEIDLDNALHGMSMTGSRATNQQEIVRSVSFPSFLESTPISRSLTSRKGFGGKPTPLSLNDNFDGLDHDISQASPFWSPAHGAGSGLGNSPSIWSPSSPGAIGQERGGAMLTTFQSNIYQQPLGNGTFDVQQQRSLYKGGRRHNEHNIGAHNVVDVNRIRVGLDVRTTIMLRNIPNKMTSAVLKGILDETSFGKYDFTYLRIDFANNCNVGYAFINFEDPIHIVSFVNARAGCRWNCYNSDKVAEISYATIQGRDCLVQKFRNSSVMLEQPSSRPKIWSTAGPNMGQEESFPGPDNPSKMRRSVENAEHVGLFAPRAGQNFRDEQRRRRSQYDRGTRLAEMEDLYETTAYQFRGGVNSMSTHVPSSAGHPQQLGPIYIPRFPGSF